VKKVLVILFGVLVFAAVAFSAAFATPTALPASVITTQPPEPTCPLPGDPLATDTVTPAVWNAGAPGYYETREWVPPVTHVVHHPAVTHEECTTTYACPIVTWTYWFHTYTVPYEKSSDPTKCHRPSDDDLEDVYGMGHWTRLAFKHDNPEHMDAIATTTCETIVDVPAYDETVIDIPGYYTEWQTYDGIPDTCSEATCRFIEGTPGYWTDPVCSVPPVYGCTDPTALNYDPEATVDDQSCRYPPEPVPGCTDPAALNYDPEATVDDESCEYPPEEVPGCTDPAALNYDPEATVDDGSCEYPKPPSEPRCDRQLGPPARPRLRRVLRLAGRGATVLLLRL
jgi:hypothetical protein